MHWAIYRPIRQTDNIITKIKYKRGKIYKKMLTLVY